MKALVYPAVGKKALDERPKPDIAAPTDAIVKITRTTICTRQRLRSLTYVPIRALRDAETSLSRFRNRANQRPTLLPRYHYREKVQPRAESPIGSFR